MTEDENTLPVSNNLDGLSAKDLSLRFSQSIRWCVTNFFGMPMETLEVVHEDAFPSPGNTPTVHFYVLDADGRRYGVSANKENGALEDFRCGRI